jgi:4-carboxymuconolactone decarboxylase
MAALPDPTVNLTGRDREIYDHMTSVRAHAEGRNTLGDVYVRMFNNAPVAAKVGALGEHLRFHGVLPDNVRELVILRFALRQGVGYEWSHHQRPAHLAGVRAETIAAVTRGDVPSDLPASVQAVLRAVNAIVGNISIPAGVHNAVINEFRGNCRGGDALRALFPHGLHGRVVRHTR